MVWGIICFWKKSICYAILVLKELQSKHLLTVGLENTQTTAVTELEVKESLGQSLAVRDDGRTAA